MPSSDDISAKLSPAGREDFYKTLRFEVRDLSKEIKGEFSLDEIFVVWFLREILNLEEALYKEALESGGPKDCGIDAFWESEGTVNILQSKFWKPSNPVDEEKIDSFLNVIDYLKSPPNVLKKRCKDYILERSADFKDYLVRGFDVRLLFVTSSVLAPAAAKKWEVEIAQRKDLSLELVTIDELHRLWRMQREHKDLNVELDISPAEVFEKVTPPSALIFTLKASTLRAWKKRFGNAILGENIRYYLSGSQVNKEMLKTLDNQDDRRNFWYFNNGITMVCSDYKLDRAAGKLKVKDIQIVNGAQTTEVVNKHFREQGGNDFDLLARLIQSVDGAFLDRVRLYNNRQNPTQPRDFASHRERQRELQKEFGTLGYFYEIRRGELSTLPRHERRAFKGITDNLTVAQAHYAFMGHPAEAKSDKKSLLDVMDPSGRYAEIFSAGTTARELLLSYLCLEYAGERFSEAKKKQRAGESSVPEHVLHGTTQIVATMGLILRTKAVIDLDAHLSDPDEYLKTISPAFLARVYDMAEEIVGELFVTAAGLYEQEGIPLQASRFFKSTANANRFLDLAAQRVKSKTSFYRKQLAEKSG